MAQYAVFNLATGEIENLLSSEEQEFYVAERYPGDGVLSLSERASPSSHYVDDPGGSPALMARPVMAHTVEATAPVLGSDTLIFSGIPAGASLDDPSGYATFNSGTGEVRLDAPLGTTRVRFRVLNFPDQTLSFSWNGA